MPLSRPQKQAMRGKKSAPAPKKKASKSPSDPMKLII